VPRGRYHVAQRPGKYAYHVAIPTRKSRDLDGLRVVVVGGTVVVVVEVVAVVEVVVVGSPG
jgi:hypothetical protein